MNDERIDIISLDGFNCPTPTRSSVTDMPASPKPDLTEQAPWPGNTYIITDTKTDLVLTLEDGRLALQGGMNPQGGQHWLVEEKNGWLGFKNTVSGTYMGHNTKNAFWCKYNHHKEHESFCARQHPEGGYVLLVRHDKDLWKVAIGDDAKGVVETKGEGTVWRFVKAQSRNYTIQVPALE